MSGNAQSTKRRRVLVIHNPVAGRRRRRHLDRAVAALDALGLAVSVHVSLRRGDGEDRARRAAFDDPPPDTVIAAGGDGTLNEVANGLVGGNIPLALLPLGSANVFAQDQHIPDNPARWAAMVAGAAPHPVHLGTANGRHFVAMVSAGFDSRAVVNVNAPLKRALGKGAYGISGLSALIHAGADHLTVTADDTVFEAGWVIVSKTRFFAGPFRLVPTADPGQPTLGLTIFPPHGMLARGWDLFLAGLGAVTHAPGAHFLTARHVRIDSNRLMPLQMDGDPAGFLPATITPGPVIPMILPMATAPVAEKTQVNKNFSKNGVDFSPAVPT